MAEEVQQYEKDGERK